MGREATAACRWGERSGRVKALLESSEFVVRGEFRARASLDLITDVRVKGESLAFRAAGEPVELDLGAAVAQRWAAALLAPPPTLARKLGITEAIRLHVVGDIDDPALQAALALAATCDAAADDADLTILRVENRRALDAYVARATRRSSSPPVWIVYTKGPAGAVGEGAIRETMRSNGFVDTKVASVSGRLTALRFDARPIVRR